jgi:hypothetical protein
MNVTLDSVNCVHCLTAAQQQQPLQGLAKLGLY